MLAGNVAYGSGTGEETWVLLTAPFLPNLRKYIPEHLTASNTQE